MFPARDKTGKGPSGAGSSPWTVLSWAVVLIAAAGCVAAGVISRVTPTEPPPEALLFEAFPDSARMEERSEPFPHYRAYGAAGESLGAVVLTDSVPPAISGYLGEIGIAAGITADGRITLVLPVRHNETPYYMEMAASSGLYDEFGGLDLSDPFPDIDTVSGATLSSRAIIEDVRETASRTARSLFNIDVPPPTATMKSSWTTWKTGLLTIFLALSLISGSTADRNRFRYLVMTVNLAGIGFILNTPLTLSALSRVLTVDLPGPGNPLLILLLVYIAVSVPLQGRSYCRLVCPFGTLQHMASRFSPWQLSMPPEISAFLPGFRRLVLGLFLILGVWLGWTGFTEVEPFFGLFSLKLTTLLWVMVIFVLTASMFIRRFWCNAMCPTGTLLSMVSRAVRPRSGRADETV